jgi:TonB family protein
MAVGLVGLLYSPSRSPPPTTQPTTVPITMDVSVVDEPMIAADVEPQPSPSPPEMSSPDLPPVQAVVLPNPAIAFAVPTDAPVRASQMPTVRHLVFGQGEGQQPQPEYPSEAAMAGQQGTVVVTFTVNEAGRVVEANATSPCPWPMLNNSALQTIRQSWRFPPGPPRAYEVAIQFLLTQQ